MSKPKSKYKVMYTFHKAKNGRLGVSYYWNEDIDFENNGESLFDSDLVRRTSYFTLPENISKTQALRCL